MLFVPVQKLGCTPKGKKSTKTFKVGKKNLKYQNNWNSGPY